jgi:hypothetical protein
MPTLQEKAKQRLRESVEIMRPVENWKREQEDKLRKAKAEADYINLNPEKREKYYKIKAQEKTFTDEAHLKFLKENPKLAEQIIQEELKREMKKRNPDALQIAQYELEQEEEEALENRKLLAQRGDIEDYQRERDIERQRERQEEQQQQALDRTAILATEADARHREYLRQQRIARAIALQQQQAQAQAQAQAVAQALAPPGRRRLRPAGVAPATVNAIQPGAWLTPGATATPARRPGRNVWLSGDLGEFATPPGTATARRLPQPSAQDIAGVAIDDMIAVSSPAVVDAELARMEEGIALMRESTRKQVEDAREARRRVMREEEGITYPDDTDSEAWSQGNRRVATSPLIDTAYAEDGTDTDDATTTRTRRRVAFEEYDADDEAEAPARVAPRGRGGETIAPEQARASSPSEIPLTTGYDYTSTQQALLGKIRNKGYKNYESALTALDNQGLPLNDEMKLFVAKNTKSKNPERIALLEQYASTTASSPAPALPVASRVGSRRVVSRGTSAGTSEASRRGAVASSGKKGKK